MKFLRNLLASILGFFISLFLLFCLFLLIAAIAGGGDEIVVKPNSVLELDLAKQIKDYAPKDTSPLAQALELDSEKLSLDKVLNAIENAQLDDNIKGRLHFDKFRFDFQLGAEDVRIAV